jgi:hypothetical protein
MIRNPSPFAPEVIEYMVLNGYKLFDDNREIGLMTFLKGDISVVFWQDKIERRIKSPDKESVTRHMRSYKGFDGKDIFELMVVLHLLKVVDLRDVKKEVYRQVGAKANNFQDFVTTLV